MTRAGMAALLWAVAAVVAVAQGYVVPRGLDNVISVKDFGAKGDGVTDDTLAVKAAIAKARAMVADPGSPYPAPHYKVRVLHFPAGEYLVSDTLQLYPDVTVYPNGTVAPPWFFRISLMLIVMGDSLSTTVVRLADGAAGFGDPTRPKPLFLTFPGYHHNDGQWLGYQDLTLRVGARNPGAIALDHISNNVGGVANLVVESVDNGGLVGITFARDLGGQCYFKNVSVLGFKTGIELGGSLMTVAFLRVSVAEATIGLAATDKMVQARHFTTAASVANPIVLNGAASLVLIDSTLDGTGPIAIDNRNGTQLFVRNVTTVGPSVAIAEPDSTVHGPHVSEFVHHAEISAFPGSAPATSPFGGVVIPDPPDMPPLPPGGWTVFDTTACGMHNGTEVLQAVLDSGATHLWLKAPYPDPNGTKVGCDVSQVVLRASGKLRVLHGGWNGIGTTLYRNAPPGFMSIRVDTMDHDDPVLIEGLTSVPGIQQNGTNELVLKQVMSITRLQPALPTRGE
jgi:hypothetical protein